MDERAKLWTAALVDGAPEVSVDGPEILGHGYRPYERYRVTLPDADGRRVTQTRDVLRGGEVIAVLAVDRARDELVLLRQFRFAAHLATGRGELIEIVAGRVEAGENLADCARRECLEEIGVAPAPLVELYTYYPTPGLTDERVTLFVGFVDAAAVPARAGAVGEAEDTRPFRIAIDRALAASAQGHVENGLLILALHWLALNRADLDAMAVSTPASGVRRP
jgi:ADP-ribose pyrophosphatase